MIAGIALYLLNPLIAIILTALGFLFGIFETLKEIRGEKKHHQIYVKYTAAKSRLEFLKAIFSVRAAHEEKQA